MNPNSSSWTPAFPRPAKEKSSKGPRAAVLPVILQLLVRNLFFWTGKRSTFFGLSRTSKHYIPDLELLLDLLQAGKISVPIKATFNLMDIRAAHREYASSQGMGSIIIEVSRGASSPDPSIE